MKILKKIFKFLGIIILILIIILTIIFFLRNKIAAYAIETQGSEALETKVEVENLYISPNKLIIKWDNFVIADKKEDMKNMIETGKCEIEFKFWPLLAKKIILNNMEIENLRYGTSRTTSGKYISKKPKTEDNSINFDSIKQQINEEKKNIPVFNPEILKSNLSVENIVKTLDLKSPEKFEQSKKQVLEKYSYWKDTFPTKNYEKRFNDLNKRFETLNKKTKSDAELIADAIKLYDDYKVFIKEIDSDKKLIESDIKLIKDIKNEMEITLKSDYDKIETMIKSPETALQNIALLLLGEKFTAYSYILIEKIEEIRKISKENEKQAKKDINENIVLIEDDFSTYPDLWIKNIKINTTIQNNYTFSGNIINLSSDQKRIKKPIEIILNSSKQDSFNISINGLIDYTGKDSIEKFNVNAKNIKLKELPVNNFDFIPVKILESSLYFDSNFNSKNKNIDFVSKAYLDKIKFEMKEKNKFNPHVYDVVNNITKRTNKIDFNLLMQNKDNKLNMKVDSNLNKIIESELKNKLNAEVNQQKAKIKSDLTSKLKPIENELDNILNNLSPVLTNVLSYDKSSNENMNKTEGFKNEYEKKLEKKVDKIIDKIKF